VNVYGAIFVCLVFSLVMFLGVLTIDMFDARLDALECAVDHISRNISLEECK